MRAPQSRLSPCWESIGGFRHVVLLLSEPLHSATVYELPVYVPSPEEQADAKLYAQNVRAAMSRACQLPMVDSSLEQKRIYHRELRQRLGLPPVPAPAAPAPSMSAAAAAVAPVSVTTQQTDALRPKKA